MSDWLVRFIPAATLLVTALLVALVGLLIPFGDAANNGPGSGQIRPGMVAIGAALMVAGAVLAWLAWGVWRVRLWPVHIALVLSATVLACVDWIAAQPARWVGSITDPATNQLVPQYDTGGQRIAIAIVPYAVAVICLIAAELRLRARSG